MFVTICFILGALVISSILHIMLAIREVKEETIAKEVKTTLITPDEDYEKFMEDAEKWLIS